MISDTKAVVYIDDKNVPAAIGKGGKNVSAIVLSGVAMDKKPTPSSTASRRAGAKALAGGCRPIRNS